MIKNLSKQTNGNITFIPTSEKHQKHTDTARHKGTARHGVFIYLFMIKIL